MVLKSFLGVALVLVSAATAVGQKTSFTLFNRSLDDDGKGHIHLNAAEGPGVAWIRGVPFTEGVIEFDIRGKDVLQQSFVGIAFHGANDSTYEAVYFRPFNFRSPDPVRKAHAVQYIANPEFDWPVLRSRYPNTYEKAVTPVPDPNGWFHARIVVNREKVAVYVNGAPAASLVVAPLVQRDGSMLGFWVGNGSDGDWRNVHVNGKPVVR